MNKDWRHELLGLLADGKFHSYWDVITLGVTMEYWSENQFRDLLKRAFDSNLITARSAYGHLTDFRDLEFKMTPKGDGCYNEVRNKLVGTKWYENHLARLKYFKDLKDREGENKEFLKWRANKRGITNTELVARKF